MKTTYIVATSVAVVLTAYLLATRPSVIVNPGPLASGHEKLRENCYVCHTPMRGTPAEKCLSCHKSGTIGVVTVDGAAIVRSGRTAVIHKFILTQECVTCHAEHSSETAGLESRFDHASVPPNIQIQCSMCHEKPTGRFHASFSLSCNSCHRMDRWKPASFDHAKFFVFDRNHPATCTSCHENTDAKSYTCFSCHEHTPQNIAREHIEEGIRQVANCAKCHRTGDAHAAKGKSGGEENGSEDD